MENLGVCLLSVWLGIFRLHSPNGKICKFINGTDSGFPRSGKSQGKIKKKFKVREKSGNFVFGQGNLKFWQKSGKRQGILESKVRPYFSVMIITVLNQ